MPPPDPQTLLFELLRQQTTNAWLIAVLALVGGAIGAAVVSYLRRWGEDKAARDNFAAIREQLTLTTRDTEDIKQQLSSHAWRSQQQWAARERYYSHLLTQLHHFKLALDGLTDYYVQPGSEHVPDSEHGEGFESLRREAATAYGEVNKLRGASAIFLSPQTVAALNELFNQHWHLANFGAVCTSDYVTEARELAGAAYDRVLAQAKQQLDVESKA